MPYALPPFDELAELARNRPDEFERLRRAACEAFINDAPEKARQRLRGLQFRIDMERRRCKTPLQACIRISAMMQDSLVDLGDTLNAVAGEGGASRPVRPGRGAQVLAFRRRQ
ncbi:MAG: DUF3135 domain-containing protein [Pseudomonadota bacterium]|nr:DUF3135 domain-containing protein [Pseudomonadota bacterium]